MNRVKIVKFTAKKGLPDKADSPLKTQILVISISW